MLHNEWTCTFSNYMRPAAPRFAGDSYSSSRFVWGMMPATSQYAYAGVKEKEMVNGVRSTGSTGFNGDNIQHGIPAVT